ncbi:MAG TPA: hypothetical protein VJM33_15460 [Microthrixaceae bacterium]|nr:hypothetical protein [Microthrixaceae bacterium]
MRVDSDGDDHQVAILNQNPESLVLVALVRSDSNDFSVDLRDDDPAVVVGLGGIVSPRRQSSDDLDELVKPQSATAGVERLERGRVVLARVSEDHFAERVIRATELGGVHVLAGFGVALTRRPLARLRRGVPAPASAARRRCSVDQRASRRAFSMREMSACGTPASSASSACVQPSAMRRSRMELPG